VAGSAALVVVAVTIGLFLSESRAPVGQGTAAGNRTPASALPTTTTTVHPLESPAVIGPRAAMVFMGDSLGGNLARGLAPVAASRGASVVPITVSGCGNIGGLPVSADGNWLPWAPTCLHNLETTWRAQVAATPASTVLWLSSFDASRRLIDGTIADPATPEGRVRIAALIRETADIVAPPGSGRRIVFFLPAPQSPSLRFGPPDPAAYSSLEHHAEILHLVIAQDPARFSMLRLSKWLCPYGGALCPLEIAPGLAPRGGDGRHLTPEGAAWLAPLILDELGVTAS